MDDLTAQVLAALAGSPATPDELAERLTAAGLDLGADPLEAIADIADSTARIYELSDGRLVDALEALGGITFTAAVADTEESVWEEHWTDLSPVWWMAAAELPLTVDGVHTSLLTGPDVIHEKRWIDATEPGVLTGFRTTNGVLDIVPRVRPEPVAPEGVVDVFRRLAEVIEAHRAPAEVDPFLFDILTDSRDVLPPVLPPLARVAEAAGLVVEDGYLVTPGWDWDAWMSEDPDHEEA